MPEPMTREKFNGLLLIALDECSHGNESQEHAAERLKPHLDALLAGERERCAQLCKDELAAMIIRSLQ